MAPEIKESAADVTQSSTSNDSETIAAQQEEFQRLLKLPLSQIKNLPQEQQDLFWQESLRETLRQVVEEPGFVDGINTAIETLKNELGAIDPTAIEPIKKFLETLLSDNTRQTLQTMATLAPYMKAETTEHPEKYEDEQTGIHELIAAAARKAREDGKDIPFLKAEEPEPEQLELTFPTDTDKEESRRKHIKEAHERHKLAQQQEALITAVKYLAIIADKDFGFSYFTRNVLKTFPEEVSDLVINKETGQINLYNMTQGKYPIEDILKEVDSIHTAFLMWLLDIAKNKDLRETNSNNPILSIYLPGALMGMGIDPRPLEHNKGTKALAKRQGQTMAEMRRDKFMELLRPFLTVAGFIGKSLYQIVGFVKYDAESETVQITTPYMFKLIEYVELNVKKHGAIRDIFHADIMTENQTAVELANRIAMGLITRGVTRADNATYNSGNPQKPIRRKIKKTAADGTETLIEETFAQETNPEVSIIPKDNKRIFSYRAKFSKLIDDCPELKREFDKIRSRQGKEEEKARQAGEDQAAIEKARRIDHKTDSQRINRKLEDVFAAAIRIIMEKSDIPKYYRRLTIKTANFDTFKPPTNSTLNNELVITHYGKNPDFSG
ncbi:MAG: hypothetical protein IKZ43_04520 [Acidaminococcaceae bacterium]|nr:hypothetical protein [Acidaminococcaceae bacterium]